MTASGKVDAFLVGRHVLGLLYALAAQRRHQDAHALWTSSAPPEAELWVHCLESGQIGARDTACYELVGAFLSSLGADPDEASRSMKMWSTRALSRAVEARDAEVCSCALSNWRLHLNEIHELDVPGHETEELANLTRQVGLEGDFWSENLWFPLLGPWRVDWTDPDDVQTIGRTPRTDS